MVQVHDKLKIIIEAVDPLADRYAAILKQLAIDSSVITKNGKAEQLCDLYQPETFDFAYCRNALDHSYNPAEAIWQIVRVLKKDCCFYLCGFQNEGQQGRYEGLHQWNFDVTNGQFVVWRPGVIINIAELFEGEMDILEASVEQRWYTIVIRKPS